MWTFFWDEHQKPLKERIEIPIWKSWPHIDSSPLPDRGSPLLFLANTDSVRLDFHNWLGNKQPNVLFGWNCSQKDLPPSGAIPLQGLFPAGPPIKSNTNPQFEIICSVGERHGILFFMPISLLASIVPNRLVTLCLAIVKQKSTDSCHDFNQEGH